MNTSTQTPEHQVNLTEAQAHMAKLLNGKPLMEAKAETFRKEGIKHSADEEEASLALDQLEKGYLRDEVTASAVDTAREKLTVINAKVIAAERMQNPAWEELQKIDRDILEAQKESKSA